MLILQHQSSNKFVMPRFLLFIVIFCMSSAFKMKDALTYYQSGLQHLDSREFVAAIADFTHAISINPKYREAYFQRGKAKLFLNEEVSINIKDALNDLIIAKELGDKEAIKLLLKKSNIECYTIKAKWKNKDDVFCLDYENASLTRFPHHINELQSLLSLHLSNNKIKSLPPFLKLKNLLVLDMDNNKLEFLPKTINFLSSLTELNVSANNLRTLPNEITQLKNLKTLYLRNNKLEKLPLKIEELQLLEVLDLSLNRLQLVPMSLYKMKNLKHLYLSGNPLSESEIQELKKRLPNAVIYF